MWSGTVCVNDADLQIFDAKKVESNYLPEHIQYEIMSFLIR